MTFRVGMKVVCVDASEYEGMLDQGAVYTITSINWPYLRVDCRTLSGRTDEMARGYRHGRFRPLVERKTSIEIFTAMLNPSKRRVSA